MYTSVICILKEQMCALLVLTEIWNNYIPKHVIFFGYHCVHTVAVYILGIFGSANPHIYLNQVKGSLDAAPSGFGSSYDEYGSDTVAQKTFFLLSTTPSNLDYKSLLLFWYIYFAMHLDIIICQNA